VDGGLDLGQVILKRRRHDRPFVDLFGQEWTER
jgi:hypothetical protein